MLGEITHAQAIEAAEHKEPQIKKGQVCEANFYGGELALLKGTKQEAVRLFKVAANECPRSFLEWSAAKAELKALGAN
jgi:lipoprotein NlpI